MSESTEKLVRLKWTAAGGHIYLTQPMPESKVEDWVRKMGEAVTGFELLDTVEHAKKKKPRWGTAASS